MIGRFAAIVLAGILVASPSTRDALRSNAASILLLHAAYRSAATTAGGRLEDEIARLAEDGEGWRSGLLALSRHHDEGARRRFVAAIDRLSGGDRTRVLDETLTLAAREPSGKDWRDAIVRAAVDGKHSSPIGYLRLGEAEIDAANHGDSAAVARAAVALRLAGETSAQGYVPTINRAKAWYLLGSLLAPRDPAAAAEAYRRAIASDPTDSSWGYSWMSAMQLAEMHLAASRWDEADAILSYAEDLPDRYHRRSYSRLGLARAAVGRRLSEHAVEILGRAVLDDPRFAPTRTRLGALLDGLGRRDLAVEQYRRALEIDPASPEARDALRRIGG